MAISAKGSGLIFGTSTVDLQANALATEIVVDAGCGGVTANALVVGKTGGAILGVHTPSTTTGCTGSSGQAHGDLGIAVLSRSAGQNAVIATGGQFPCTFDSAPATTDGGYYVTASTTSVGLCHDSGTPSTSAPPPTGGGIGQVIGILLSTTAVSGNYMVLIKPAF